MAIGMNLGDRSELDRWAKTFGWDTLYSTGYLMLRRRSCYVVVALNPVPPGGNVAYRTTDREQDKPDYATSLAEVYVWLVEPVSPFDRFDRPKLRPRPPAPPEEPAPPIARSVARFREMEF